MPRQPDPELESRILVAARKLWRKGGEKTLTMRAVALEAGTNTPAVYRRFRNRKDIIRALLHRMRLDFAELMESAPSAEQACERYLDYALSHPNEYELFHRYDYELDRAPASRRPGTEPGRPARHAMAKKLAERLGGSPKEHENLVIALWMLAHGAAMLLIAKSVLPEDSRAARRVFTNSVRTLLRQAEDARK